MTLKVEPVVQWTGRPRSKALRLPSDAAPSRLDSWHKVEDSGSGVTYFWSAKDYRWRNSEKKEGHHQLQHFQSNAKRFPSPTSSFFVSSRSLLPFPVTRDRNKHRNPLFKHHLANNQQTNNIQLPVVCSTSGNKRQNKDRDSGLTPAYHTRPTVVLRKPRTRRFIRTLLCCFGAKPVEAPKRNVNLVDQPPSSPYSPKPSEKLLLPPVRACDINKKCLIIDLDETLVHSSFKPVKNPDFVIPVEIDGVIHQVYVLKRPYVDEFLQRIGDLFECILFTASLAKYADPVADLLDKWGVFRARLFREACVFHKGNYVKDLNRLGRDLKRVVIVDNSPASYSFHPDNAIPVQSWFDDMSDTELLDLVPILERLATVDNVYSVLRNCNEPSPPPPSLDQHHHLTGNGNR